jgi:microcystin-dependent protein
MSSPYIGEIRMFGGNFAPAGWALCNGALMPISENDTLFQLIGTTYGGDGQSTFGLPDLQGRVPLHFGTGPGMSTYTLAEQGGVESVMLTMQQIPAHSHPIIAEDDNTKTTATDPTNHLYGNTTPNQIYSNKIGALQPMLTMVVAGGSQPHSNLQPLLAVTFIISLFGIFPSPT